MSSKHGKKGNAEKEAENEKNEKWKLLSVK